MSSYLRLLLVVSFTKIAWALPTPGSSSSKTSSVPLNGLPAPNGLTLKYVALGMGTQNYTCSAAGSTPVSIGAVASLYDATFLSYSSNSASIPTFAALAYSTSSWFGLPTLGHHWFSASSVPTFDLEGKAFLSAKKVASVSAPDNSVDGSVDWLFLEDDGRGVSKNLKAVYRVETAGGEATCTKAGTVQVKYAAEYWFYD